MLFHNNKGIRISYKIKGEGKPIILVHGGFGYKEMWEETGVVRGLKNSFKTITIDLRGHGLSDKPHNPADYSMEFFVSDIVSLLDHLGIDKIRYWGNSMGGWIGFGMIDFVGQP